MILFSIPALAVECGEILPTLHDYRVAKDGEAYLKGSRVYPPIRDSKACAKLRFDREVWRCRWGKGKVVLDSNYNKRTLQMDRKSPTVPFIVAREQRRPVGKSVEWDRERLKGIRDAWVLYRKIKVRMAAARGKMLAAEVPYREIVAKLKQDGCWNPTYGVDPILGK